MTRADRRLSAQALAVLTVLLESRWLEPERPGRPARHAYRLTAAGRIALREATPPAFTIAAQGI